MQAESCATRPNQLEDDLQREAIRIYLSEALDRATMLDRQILALYCGAGLDVDEIAEELDMLPSAVASRIDRALNHVRIAMAARRSFRGKPVTGRSALRRAGLAEVPVPAGLHARVLQELERRCRSLFDHAPVPSRRRIPWLVPACAALFTALGCWLAVLLLSA